jgi:hypothetical protein
MTDFRAAFRTGQEAAIQAELARKGIDEIFSVICAELAEVTDGKVEILRKEYEKETNWFEKKGALLFAPREKYWAIAARNPRAEDNKLRQVALWEQGRTGYPCKISWGDIDRTCHDRESLEDCLASLLGDPVVGEKLRGVMMLPLPKETGESATSG